MVKNLPADAGDTRDTVSASLQYLGMGRSPGVEELSTRSSILAWKIPWTGAWKATVLGITESDMTEQMSMHMCINKFKLYKLATLVIKNMYSF